MSMFTKVIVMGLVMASFSLVAQEDQTEESEATEERFDKSRPSWSSGLPERKKNMAAPRPSIKPEIENEIEIDVSEFGLIDESEAVELPEAIIETTDEQAPADAQVETAAEVVETEVVETEVVEPEAIEAEPVNDVAEESTDSSTLELPVEEPPVNEQPVDEQPAEEVVNTEEPVDEVIEVESQPSSELVSIEDNAVTVSSPTDNTIEQAVQQEYKWLLLERVSPEYPRQAAREQLEGWVDVEVLLGPNGEVVDANVKKTSRKGNVFSRSALTAVKKWRFEQPTAEQMNSTELRKVYRLDFTF